MPATEQQTGARALAAFLDADPAQWPSLAPGLLELVGAERLRTIVGTTRERIGTPVQVTDSPEGLIVAGPRGQVLAWVSTRSGQLDGLLISPQRRPARRQAAGISWAWRYRLVWFAVLLVFTISLWTATDRGSWTSTALLALAAGLGFEGMAAPAMQPWWFRRPAEALALPAVASISRWPHLAHGGAGWTPLGAAGLVAVTLTLIHDRRHRWGAGPGQPLPRFPLQGRWYIAQGGGRRLNHHFGVRPQRGAIDLVMTGPQGTVTGRGRSLPDYLAYGQDVLAPCDGTVDSVVDGLPDQAPGVIRYGPPYGNHVVISTGAESVMLAHLRPGTVPVVPGQVVRQGELLGQVGNSGNSTEPHLHLQAERGGDGLDLRFREISGGLYRGRTIRA